MTMMEIDRTKRRNKAALVLLAGYSLALVVGTHIPNPPEVIMSGPSDKSLHLAAYAGLAFLVSLNWFLRQALGWRQRIAILGLLAVFGAVDEITQIPVGRECDVFDWTADVAGALVGSALFLGAAAVFRRPAQLRRN
ncbi:MAG: VanZ family protein [Planctomycetia bacterium]|nr:VanZ family protein [Planctomycetia bacterium]